MQDTSRDNAIIQVPERKILIPQDLQHFRASPVKTDLLKFIAAMGKSIVGKSCNDDVPTTSLIDNLVSILGKLESWVDEIPPERSSMRFGNKAFRKWHLRVMRESLPMCESLLPEDKRSAAYELAVYFSESFGNHSRIDYGTGHETCFVIFLYCLGRVGMLTPELLPALVLRVFDAYMKVCRKLQRTYWLEPAGSHGVWSLDDYQFLVFLFGAYQLSGHPEIRPRSALSEDIQEMYVDDYLFLAAIQFVNVVKTGAPFHEHSPMLSDLLKNTDWNVIQEDLFGMYRQEVLDKFPVVQHMLFGKLFPASWTPTRPSILSETAGFLKQFWEGEDLEAITLGASSVAGLV